MRQTIKRWGNSPAVRIPAELMKAAHLRLDDEVELSLDNKGRILLERAEKTLTLAMLLDQVTAENLHPELIAGEDNG
ncbi:AbrB/MazE/SpoVT family DNA-binding domain-containing protein [Chimaeribacter arupi]|uniref:AbrB/MazE/SpoVT family DNA-binding domain-containing protein n=2 Tax=Yersiniaceae TaxID=1903411 RepID=A0A2N5EHL1_9GAMM|nr:MULTISPECIES: AbrB/MazE/SpoVT family DNA-binding domain-containing protein [Yersiniaceae]MBS0971695.1 AbrB/MazE/SpoVT family DNA-binding domain-containing protein [Nissabacter archeti]MDV5139328.1 AbrB/MazE/SpoVT family DNA-binding domain-containing protein [Chimaeribacter arupi]PLR29640.1 AbrB/MazE/SpoVT family DNA-binding domain-containing protein [Chimaeribacter arupi]PLR43597.1 AbrB/MazE/SpoVT family DNA-binding domain-containing protein [Chimaeribacter arupi]PLR44601.1 AbrB/MazE/SpoVT 